MFLTDTGDDRLSRQELDAFIAQRGNSARAFTSGKGFGRRGNPKGKDGKPLKCRGCGSEDHLVRECPVKGGEGGGGMPFAAWADQHTYFNEHGKGYGQPTRQVGESQVGEANRHGHPTRLAGESQVGEASQSQSSS